MTEIEDKLKQNEAIVYVAGLGYVGLPLAIKFSNTLDVLKKIMNDSQILVDVRGMFDEEARKKGFCYRCL